MAKRVINDQDAKYLIEKLNHRMGAVAFLTSRRFSWQGVLVQIVVLGSVSAWLNFSGRREDWLLYFVVLALWATMETYIASADRRIDTLIELLRQEGMLRTELPPCSVPES